ncbi:PREDICTED: uncharacterized protein LOC106110118 [Papilio polytes]|uniref:uncharacterized protein LOC106110118 n=1 Tax=Papilio polytes TaxID=76194 RepID=UPI000676969A|nr:PREDICTED: uncharacterized protein LOC106110118 [Papilio polytes]
MRFKCLYVAVSLVFLSIFCEELSDKLNNSTVEYDPEALLIKIFNLNGTIQSRTKFNFEESDRDVYFDSNKMISKVNDNIQLNTNEDKQEITFLDDNRVGKVKKRRRRKPRVQGPQGLTPGYYGPYAPYVQPPGIGGSPFYGQDPSGIYRPPNRQRPSLATEALSTVSEALTSIALFDDRECVARLLCEAASGAPVSGTLQSIAGLQPLLT